jgi:two-component system, OmpR family, response regulator VicR
MKILVCDDDLLTVKAVEYRLKKDGYEVVTALDGLQGADILKSNSNGIDFLITDQHMPFYSGLELINLVRNDLKMDIPIIMLTRVGVDAVRNQAFDLGADEYVTKPFSPDVLLFKVKHVLMKREHS